MNLPMHIRQIRSPGDPAIAAATAIYLASIPASERKPAGWIAHAASRADFVLLIAADLSHAPIGFSLSYQPANQTVALLEYLAVEDRHRGRGVGAALFAATQEALHGRAILVEVDAIAPTTTASEDIATRDAIGRQAFYRRLGCRRIADLAYQLPLPTTPPPPLMDLLIATAPSPLRRSDLSRWLACIYTGVYTQPADDPLLAQMTQLLPEIVALD